VPPALEAGLRDRGLSLRDVRTILLTHIHLDHAGAAGTIVERVPGIRVYVHERGAPHMIDPSRLMASVTRLYGEQMDVLWGAFRPVPNWRSISARLPIAGRSLKSPIRANKRSIRRLFD
jgi:glyoxylase-like metal-dependent hydrolase (beta-lactamase superfamily II)